jgi:putative DNA primase/helicase
MTIEISHDAKIDLAVGKSRRETSWKNREWQWSKFVEKVRNTHRTAETYSEYIASKKVRQDEIKDIGGFVGGYLAGGRRKSGSVTHRQLVTLDIDFAREGFWDDFTLAFTNAAVVYSTHKHNPESPRLRLIMPLDRPVLSDEYEAIARKIAGIIDIELFDPTTFQPERLMYWPSTSKDGAFFFEYQDGNFLNADKILASYHDWKDSSEWPVSSKAEHIIQRNIKKQGDPLDKLGIVGAFCRTYSIHEAIELYLAEEYEACDVENRYTYKEGSTAAGLIVYDDKYAYSHHGTDPTSGKLCNAFDLVRLHKFGLKDEDAAADCPNNRLPSYTAMIELATKDANVKKQLAVERIEEAKKDFYFVDEETDEEDDQEWITELDVDGKGDLRSTHSNIKLILEKDSRLKGCFAYDEFKCRKIVMRNLPWRKISHDSRYLRDEDEQNLVIYLSSRYNIVNRANTKEVLDTHIAANTFHPVRDYLNALQWDGNERVETLLAEYLGALDTPYIRAVTRKTLTAAVARVMNPGCKFDYVLTLVGEEGKGKSFLMDKLGQQWFSDSFNFGMLHGQSNKAYEQLTGAWIIEVGELVGLRKAEAEAVKGFLSKREDTYRVSYGRNLSTFLRQNIFVASTNIKPFLREAAGNRRWWPVEIEQQTPVKDVFTDLTKKEIDQIWAEAVCLYRAGETLFLDKQMEDEARHVQKSHTEQDDRIGLIHEYLKLLLPQNWDDMGLYERRAWLQSDDPLAPEGVIERKTVCIAEIWCEVLGGTSKDMTSQNTKPLHQIMQSMKGWRAMEKTVRTAKYGVQRMYEKIDSEFVTQSGNAVEEVVTQ